MMTSTAGARRRGSPSSGQNKQSRDAGGDKKDSSSPCVSAGPRFISFLLIVCFFELFNVLYQRRLIPSWRIKVQPTVPERDVVEIDTATNNDDSVTPVATIAYAVSISRCMNLDGAAVLKHSVHLSSIRGTSNSKYDYHMYAFVHPDASACAQTLEQFGYTVLIKETPVDVLKEIKDNPEMVRRVMKTGCCNEKEFLKLYSYTMTDYPVVVHLDLDALILQPLDDLFDAMILFPANATKSVPAGMWETEVSHPINAFFVLDHFVARDRPLHRVGVQGGFLVLRPDLTVFEEYCNIIRRGELSRNGWTRPGDELQWGGFWGEETIQGIVPYFYGRYQPNTHVELHHCYYNQMVDPPYSVAKCAVSEDLLNQRRCEDCRHTDITKIYMAHFTICWKPWGCPDHNGWPGETLFLCAAFHHEWHRVRKHWELSVAANDTSSEDSLSQYARTRENWTDFQPQLYSHNSFGHCLDGNHYVNIEIPNSTAVAPNHK